VLLKLTEAMNYAKRQIHPKIQIVPEVTQVSGNYSVLYLDKLDFGKYLPDSPP
jgi:hypothetical protein